MELLAEEKIKKTEEFTKDFRILPNRETIYELIESDSDQYANEIKEKLFAKIKSGRGVAFTTYVIPDLHRRIIVKKLHKWAKLHDYKCQIDGNTISIWLKGLNKKRMSTCNQCGQKPKTLRRVLWSIGSGVFIMGSAITASIFIDIPGWYAGLITIGVLGSIMITGWIAGMDLV